MDAAQVEAALREAAFTLYDASTTNEARRATYENVERGVQTTDPDVVVAGALRMLGNADCPPAHQAFAGSIATDLVRRGMATISAIPYAEYAQFLRTKPDAPTAHRTVVASVASLLALVAEQRYPEHWPEMLDTLCPEDLANHPACAAALETVVACLFDPPTGRLTADRIRVLRRGSNDAAFALCQRSVSAIGVLMTSGAPHQQREGGAYEGPPMSAIYGSLLSVVTSCVARLVPEQWWGAYVHELVAALLRGGPGASSEALQAASNIFATLLAVTNGGGKSGNLEIWVNDATASELLSVVLYQLPALVAAGHTETVETIAESFAELPPDSPPVVGNANDLAMAAQTVLLEHPSMALASVGCALLHPALSALANQTNGVLPTSTSQLLMHILQHAQKHQSHPTTGWTDAAAIHAERFSTPEAFEEALGMYRGRAAPVVQLLSAIDPQGVMDTVAKLISELPAPSQGSDPMNPFGHIDQRSPTFVRWEATAFVLDNCGAAVRHEKAAPHVEAAFTVLFQRRHQIRDATLIPVLLNLISGLWPSVYQAHWPESVQTLTYFAALDRSKLGQPRQNNSNDDPDVASARKRGAALLVRACNDFGEHLSEYSTAVVHSAQQLIITGRLMPHEIGLLYEALVSLSNAMEPEAAGQLISSMLGRKPEHFVEQVKALTPHSTATLIIGDTHRDRDDRNAIRDSLHLLTPLLRRAKATPALTSLAEALMPAYSHLLACLMQLGDHLPPRFAYMMQLGPTEKRAIATGGNQRPPGKQEPQAAALYGIKTAVYGGIAALVRIMGDAVAAEFRTLLATIGDGDQGRPLLPTHLVKQMCTHCFLEAVEAAPSAVTAMVLEALGKFFVAHSALVHPSNSEDAAVEDRLVTNIFRATSGVLKRCVTGPNLHVNDANLSRALFEFWHAVLRSGYECKTLVYELLPWLDNPEDHEAQRTFDAFIATVPHPRLSPHNRSFLVDKLSDAYMKHFPHYAVGLGRAGIPEAAVEEFHQQLLGMPRPDARRRCMAALLSQHYGLPITSGK
jgi:hypothetical protein